MVDVLLYLYYMKIQLKKMTNRKSFINVVHKMLHLEFCLWT